MMTLVRLKFAVFFFLSCTFFITSAFGEESHKDTKAYKTCKRYQEDAKKCHSQLLKNTEVGFFRGLKCAFGSTNPACDSFLHITDPNYCFAEQSRNYSRYMILYDGEKNTCYLGLKQRAGGRIYLHITKGNDYYARDEFGRQQDLIDLLKGDREALEARAKQAHEIYTSEMESLRNQNKPGQSGGVGAPRTNTPSSGGSGGSSSAGGTQ